MLVLTDCRINENCLTELKNLGFEAIFMPPALNLQSGVSSHTDMLLFLGFGKLFCHGEYYRINTELIERIANRAKLEVVLSDEKWSAEYPHDVLFNACTVGKRLLCNEKTVSRLIIDEARSQGYGIINVPQGYTKCSVCVVSDNAIITADRAIAAACTSAGIDALLVTEGHVSLPPYEFGFIGGASGVCGDNIYFCGSLDTHPDSQNIKGFCQKYGRSVISLSNDTMQDVGSLIFI